MGSFRKLSKLIALLAAAAVLSMLLAGCNGAEKKKTSVSYGKESQKLEAVKLADDWYGWWKMEDTTGDWKDMSGLWWDCCGEISRAGDDYSLLIWDEDMPKDNYLAKLSFTVEESKVSLKGGELMSMTLSGDDCTIRLLEDEDGQMLRITGRYYLKGIGSFVYSMRLRPWGELWPEEEDELPYFYESWYLPLINDDKPMPDAIG